MEQQIPISIELVSTKEQDCAMLVIRSVVKLTAPQIVQGLRHFADALEKQSLPKSPIIPVNPGFLR